ncbi:hypothetical protein BMS3Abin07_00981 [bacterium BMS3Abin07]|nr:hypothetical protein BMS3Abin07_00981 [bacterium BMS3Abin07]HDL20327.1 hypothetical protein [Nitrospirota bacterium]HDO22684.1 hypothetical protein [Nitrospirota bacterium]HDZ89032.1 hypothetical protein [Nitrospirota bacterium]
MNLGELLLQKRNAISKSWFSLIVDTYPPDTSSFLRKQKDQFSNPVGSAISQGIEGILDEIMNGLDPERVSPFLDKLIRVRAVQEFTPSEAVGFVFMLKKVIRENLDREIRDNRLFDELTALESRIDDLAGIAFNIYMECREKIFELKATELNRWTHKLLERVNLSAETRTEEDE